VSVCTTIIGHRSFVTLARRRTSGENNEHAKPD
jgi:hypothetical protein